MEDVQCHKLSVGYGMIKIGPLMSKDVAFTSPVCTNGATIHS